MKTTFTQEIADKICERLADGESLRSICLGDGMPSRSTIFLWLESSEEFRTKYARARGFQAETLVDEMQDIADDGQNDWMEKFGRDGKTLGWEFNKEAAARSKLRLEQRRWFAEKLLPKKYGPKLDLNVDATVRGSVSYRANIPTRPKEVTK